MKLLPIFTLLLIVNTECQHPKSNDLKINDPSFSLTLADLDTFKIGHNPKIRLKISNITNHPIAVHTSHIQVDNGMTYENGKAIGSAVHGGGAFLSEYIKTPQKIIQSDDWWNVIYLEPRESFTILETLNTVKNTGNIRISARVWLFFNDAPNLDRSGWRYTIVQGEYTHR